MKYWLLFAILYSSFTGWVQAEIYKNIDADGHVTYSSSPSKGARRLNLERLPAIAAPPRARNNATPADFPRIDSDTQRNLDNVRRKILGDELGSEEKLLAEARSNLQYAMENPAVYDKDGNTLLDVAAYKEKVNTLQKQVTLHENNIAAIKTELLKSK